VTTDKAEDKLMKYALIALALAVAASAATYARYESLDPCDWMAQDLARESGLPTFMVEAKIRAQFLLDGVTNPTTYQCLSAWWKVRAESASEKS
jgi:hypothetical protein